MRNTYIIAEIGCNHCGDVGLAIDMIEMAAQAGVDAVKLQIRDLRDPPIAWYRPYTGPNSYGETYMDHRVALELERPDHQHLIQVAHECDLEIGTSIWSSSCMDLIDGLGFDWIKIPSAMATNEEIINMLGAAGIPTIASIGACTDGDVRRLLHLYPDVMALLVCTMAYPVEPADVHLRRLAALRSLCNAEGAQCAKVGISGHWRGIQIDAAAIALGAKVVERHITMDRTMKGTDHAASLEPGGLARVVRDIEVIEAAMGSSELQVLKCETSAVKKLRV